MSRLYTVQGQVQRRQIVGQEAVEGIEVTFAGPNDVTGTVFIPLQRFTPQVVDAEIRARLAQHMQVAELGEATPGA